MMTSQFEHAFFSSFNPNTLDLIVLPTEQCNFRCTYCYETFERGRMSPAVIQGLERFILRQLEGGRALKLGWFGGEPLVAKDIILQVSKKALSWAEEREVPFFASATTNGFSLDLPLATKLREAGLREYQISLDGPPRYHNSTRRLISGRGTFERIWSNLLEIRSSTLDLHIILRLHLTPENAGALPTFVDQLGETFLNDSRFSLLFAPVEHLGGPSGNGFAVLGDLTGERLIAELRARVAPPLDPKEEPVPHVCYASKPNSLLIRSDGVIAKCTVALDDPDNHIGQLLEDGTVRIDNAKLRPWLRGWQTRDWAVLHCPLVGIGKACGKCAAS